MCGGGLGSTTASLPFAGSAVAAFVVLFIPGKRRRAFKGLLVALITLCGMATLTWVWRGLHGSGDEAGELYDSGDWEFGGECGDDEGSVVVVSE